METPAHQEWRARQKVNWRAVLNTALFVGAIMFVMSGGSPWSSAGTMNAIMGRDLPTGIFTLLFFHFLLSLIYVAVIAHAIYRLRLVPSLFAGVATGLGLYAVNYAVFHGLPIQMQSPEGRALFTHVTFSLFASAVYKAMSVPRPFRGDRARVEAETRASVTAVNAGDPEPYAVHPEARRGETN